MCPTTPCNATYLQTQGIVRGLMEQGLLPRIIAGSSVGAIVAAIAAVHTDKELKALYTNIHDFNLSFFANETTMGALGHLMAKGSLQGTAVSPHCALLVARAKQLTCFVFLQTSAFWFEGCESCWQTLPLLRRMRERIAS
jgi:hypothetical protein